MSKDRKINWPSHGISHGITALIGGTIAIIALKGPIDEIVTDTVHDTFNNHRSIPTSPRTTYENIVEPSFNLPLSETPLGPEILDSIRQNLVIINRSTLPGYEQHVSGASCSGFIIRDLVNKPAVITAGHCIPHEIISEADGKTYTTLDENGNSIFHVTIIGPDGESYDAVKWYFYDDPLNAIAVGDDVMKIYLNEENNITSPGLPINIAELKPAQPYYLVRNSTEDGFLALPIYFLDSLGVNENRFIDLSNAAASCV